MLIIFTIVTTLARAESIHIASASNFSAALEKISQAFTVHSGHKLIISYGSTGKLYAQIKQGAPFEIFLSADEHHAHKLVAEGKGIQGTVFNYAIGKLVLWSPDEKAIDPQGEVLKQTNEYFISLANPRLAPYGLAAKEVLKKKGLWEKVQKKIVLGENINQAFQFVATGNSKLGFVSYSQMYQQGKISGSYWMIPQNLYSPLKQSAVLIKNRKNNKAAQEFMAFLKTPQIKEMIKESGYEVEDGKL